MFSIAPTAESFLKPAPRARGQDRSCSSSSSRRFNTSPQAVLRRPAYDKYARLVPCSKDPVGYRSGISLYEYVGSSPAVFVDSSGLGKCRIAIALGHVWDVEDFVDDFSKQGNECDVFAPLCCFMDKTKRICMKKGRVLLPNLPSGDGFLHCFAKDKLAPDDLSVEEEFPKLLGNITSQRDTFCDKDKGCGCKAVLFQIKCNKDKKHPPLFADCIDELTNQGLIKIPFNPCRQNRTGGPQGGNVFWSCPTESAPGYFYRKEGGRDVPFN
jgi:hypothetical protein